MQVPRVDAWTLQDGRVGSGPHGIRMHVSCSPAVRPEVQGYKARYLLASHCHENPPRAFQRTPHSNPNVDPGTLEIEVLILFYFILIFLYFPLLLYIVILSFTTFASSYICFVQVHVYDIGVQEGNGSVWIPESPSESGTSGPGPPSQPIAGSTYQ